MRLRFAILLVSQNWVAALLVPALTLGCGKAGAGRGTIEPVRNASYNAVEPKEPRYDPEPSTGRKPVMSQNDQPPRGHPSEFFPSVPGTRWVYEVELGDLAPVTYSETAWPMGDGRSAVYANRGFLRGAVLRGETEKHTFALVMCVKGPAKTQGPLKYPNGVELEIGTDELGIFDDSKQVFWAISSSGRFMANLVVTYDPDTTPGAPRDGPYHGWGLGDGSSMRLVFFGDKPGIGIGLKGSPDTLRFIGMEHGVESLDGVDCLHFVREVVAAEHRAGEKPVAFEQKFTEDTWFARAKGLVRLEQKIEGQTSMVWKLKSVSLGSGGATRTQ